MDEEEELDLDDGEPDEEFYVLVASPEDVLPFRGKLSWRLVGLVSGLACDLLECWAVAFRTFSTLMIQRASWEEERQQFSDSVKSDFLSVKTLETTEKEG